MNLFELQGKTAVVTGGSGKLGTYWIKVLLEYGARVAVLDIKENNSTDESAVVMSEGEKHVRFYSVDITSKNDVSKVLEQIKTDFVRVDILVNNAGIDSVPNLNNTTYLLEDFPGEIMKKVFDVNILGAVYCMQVFGKHMIENGGGSIINIGSLYASVSPDKKMYDHMPCDPPFIKQPAYGASKFALLGLTKYFATHWAEFGVRVNMLSPGGIEGDQSEEFKAKFINRVPLKRMGVAEDLYGPLIFLASSASRYVTGENLRVDGGFTAW